MVPPGSPYRAVIITSSYVIILQIDACRQEKSSCGASQVAGGILAGYLISPDLMYQVFLNVIYFQIFTCYIPEEINISDFCQGSSPCRFFLAHLVSSCG